MSEVSQELQFCSPPKLTRLIAPPQEIRFREEQKAKVPVGTTESPVSLTSLTAKVVVEQKDQADELIKRKLVVLEMKKAFDQVQDTIKSLKREISTVSRKISLVQDHITKQSTSCKKLEKDVEQLISEGQSLTYKLSAKKKKFTSDQQLYDDCRVKMKNHIKLYDNYDALSSRGKQIKMQEDIILQLQDELQQVAGGITHERAWVQKDISDFQSLIIELKENIKRCKNEIVKEQDRQSLLKRDKELLQRRNAAQLTRLKRQVQEAHVRNRQWNEKACQLEKTISDITRKITEE